MRKRIAALLLAALLAGCGGLAPDQPSKKDEPLPAPAKEVDASLAAANTRFSLALLQAVYREKPGESHFLSPAGAQVILSLTANGAQGETRQAMLQALQYGSMTLDEINQANGALQTILANPDPKVELNLANALWHQKGLEPAATFLAAAKQHYRAEVSPATFGTPQAVKAINDWASAKTREKIPKVLDETKDDDLMILVNAIYFNGAWQSPFEPEATREAPFTRLDGSQKQVPFMQKQARFGYLEAEGIRGARLPYGEGRLGLYVLMPDRWDGFVDGLSPERWAGWMKGFSTQEIRLAMPKVKMEYEAELVTPLTALGMGLAFSDQADFSGLFEKRVEAYIRRVLQKSYLEINEKGTEAAAVTVVVVSPTSAPAEPPKELKLDRPFLLAIRDEQTGLLLFVGTVLEP